MNSTKSREPTLTLVNYWLALPRTADGPLVHVRDFLEETADDDDEPPTQPLPTTTHTKGPESDNTA